MFLLGHLSWTNPSLKLLAKTGPSDLVDLLFQATGGLLMRVIHFWTSLCPLEMLFHPNKEKFSPLLKVQSAKLSIIELQWLIKRRAAVKECHKWRCWCFLRLFVNHYSTVMIVFEYLPFLLLKDCRLKFCVLILTSISLLCVTGTFLQPLPLVGCVSAAYQ